jgi:hypothetical protein
VYSGATMGNRSAKPPTRNSGPARVATGADDDDLDEEVEEARAPGLWASARQGYGVEFWGWLWSALASCRCIAFRVVPAPCPSCRYEEVVKAIIRPPRAEYDVEDLGG